MQSTCFEYKLQRVCISILIVPWVFPMKIQKFCKHLKDFVDLLQWKPISLIQPHFRIFKCNLHRETVKKDPKKYLTQRTVTLSVWVCINEGVSKTYEIMCERIKLSVEKKSYGVETQGTLSWRNKIHMNININRKFQLG